jgi:hypothetical protein
MAGGGDHRYVGRIPNCALPKRLAIFRLGPSVVLDRDSLISGRLNAAKAPGLPPPGPFHFLRFALIMNQQTKPAIIGLGVTVLMLLGVAALMLWRS